LGLTVVVSPIQELTVAASVVDAGGCRLPRRWALSSRKMGPAAH